MSEETHTWGCEECSPELAELALGVLTGRERARALAHVDSCPRCAEELEQLSRAADTMLQAAPDAEPPMGFEVRLFERMGVSESPRRERRHRWSPRWVPAGVAAAAAAVAALGVGLGLTLTSSPTQLSVAQGHAHGTVESDNLVQDGRTVGHVVYFDGAKPWMSMMLADTGVQGQVNCVVVSKDGVTHMVGTFTAHGGYGAWYAPLHMNPDDLRTAQMVSPSGTVLATARLT
jgi:anti-sigma-K factor RskA